jgi:hypothetical protein
MNVRIPYHTTQQSGVVHETWSAARGILVASLSEDFCTLASQDWPRSLEDVWDVTTTHDEESTAYVRVVGNPHLEWEDCR